MGSLREIKERIVSVRSTLKITSAMKLVASSKLRKAQKAVETMLPYRRALEGVLSSLPSSPAFSESREGKTVIVAIASNSSLCGAFNVNAVKATLEEASKFEDAEVIAVGRKMADAMKRAGFPQAADYSSLVGKPSYEEAADLAQSLVDRFLAGECARVELVFNHFESASRQVPVVEKFLPVISDNSAEEENQPFEEYIFEPEADEIAENLMPLVQKLKVYTAVLDSAAAEQAARTIAMQTASDNAEDILSELTLEYNKGRQQKITSEILDLVGGSAQ